MAALIQSLKELKSTPFVVKALLFYYFTIILGALMLPFSPAPRAANLFFIPSIALAAVIFIFILKKKSIVWKLGLIDCGYSLIGCAFLLNKSDSFIAMTFEELNRLGELTEIPEPELIRTFISVIFHFTVAILIISIIILFWLWMKSRTYFIENSKKVS